MLQLHVTDDRGAVTTFEASVFPLTIGRSPQAGIRIAAAGVFENHAQIDLADVESQGQRFFIQPVGQGHVLVNGEVVTSKRLVLGDEISLGAARMVVSLAPARQPRLGFHEAVVWGLLLLVVTVEAVVIHFAQ